jgi:transcriptional regulator with XRE-family HTH domain
MHKHQDYPTLIRKARIRAGYKTQEAFAFAAKISQSTVSEWESGKSPPNIERLRAAFEAAGCRVRLSIAVVNRSAGH